MQLLLSLHHRTHPYYYQQHLFTGLNVVQIDVDGAPPATPDTEASADEAAVRPSRSLALAHAHSLRACACVQILKPKSQVVHADISMHAHASMTGACADESAARPREPGGRVLVIRVLSRGL